MSKKRLLSFILILTITIALASMLAPLAQAKYHIGPQRAAGLLAKARTLLAKQSKLSARALRELQVVIDGWEKNDPFKKKEQYIQALKKKVNKLSISLVKVSYKTVERLLKKKFGQVEYMKTFDSTYTLVNRSLLASMLAKLRSEASKAKAGNVYIDDDQDCDDQSWVFKTQLARLLASNAVGFVCVEYKDGSRHALNFVITEEKEVFFIEPQSLNVVSNEGDVYLVLL